jgi:hypothetical protein
VVASGRRGAPRCILLATNELDSDQRAAIEQFVADSAGQPHQGHQEVGSLFRSQIFDLS